MAEEGVETRVSRAGSGIVHRARMRANGWTVARRSAFLAELADSCNVKMAAAAVKMDVSGAYALRRRDDGFDAQWRDALTLGYERLEAAVLHQALIGVGAIDVAALAYERDDGGVPAIDHPASGARASALSRGRASPEMLKIAITMLDRSARSQAGRALCGVVPATAAQTDASLRRELDRLARKLARDAGARTADGVAMPAAVA